MLMHNVGMEVEIILMDCITLIVSSASPLLQCVTLLGPRAPVSVHSYCVLHSIFTWFIYANVGMQYPTY
jgi:hypothetical protein